MNRFKHSMKLVFAIGILSISAGCMGLVKKSHDDHERRMRNAIRINPVHELGYIRLAQYLESKHRYAETFEVLRDAQQHIPESITLIRLEGRLFQGLGMYPDAEKFYTEQLVRHPENPLFFLDRAQMHWLIKNHELALEDAKKALSLNQDLLSLIHI